MTTLSSQEKVVNERLAKAFDSVLTFAQEKARFPLIREYCQEILKLEFNGDHSYCPIHTGHGGHAFEITDSTQKWQCWSHCRDNCPRHGNDTIDYTQPCTCRGDVLDLHMLCFEFESKREAINSLINGDGKSLPRRADKFFVLPQETKPKAKKVNERLVARIEREFHFVDRSYLERASGVRSPVAADFAQMFLEDILRPDDLPIVFFTKFEAIIGRKAVDALERVPDRLQYLCRSTAKSARGSNTLDNLQERLFVNVEFDGMPLEKQLPRLWYLKVRGEWPLISITHSAGESYHGLFYVRGFSEARIKRMKDMAVSLGACNRSCRQEHTGVRFPGGWRTLEDDWKQTGVGRQEIIYLRNPLSF